MFMSWVQCVVMLLLLLLLRAKLKKRRPLFHFSLLPILQPLQPACPPGALVSCATRTRMKLLSIPCLLFTQS